VFTESLPSNGSLRHNIYFNFVHCPSILSHAFWKFVLFHSSEEEYEEQTDSLEPPSEQPPSNMCLYGLAHLFTRKRKWNQFLKLMVVVNSDDGSSSN
jgi:hypothetical protein